MSARHAQENPHPLLSVVMPAYNEESCVREILAKVAAVELDKEIVIVDDCSTDGTLAEIERFGRENPGVQMQVLRHERNLGKTAAVRDGLAAAAGEVVVIQEFQFFKRQIGAIIIHQTDTR